MKTKLEKLYKQEEQLFCKLASLVIAGKDDKNLFSEKRWEIIREMGQIRDRISAILRRWLDTL